MSVFRTRRTKEEVLLLLVSASAAALVVASVVRVDLGFTVIELATAAAFAVALVAGFAFWFAGATRRALAETATAAEEDVRRVLEAVPEGLLVVAGDRLLSVNRRLCELLGYPRDELVGAPAPFPFWPPEHRHELERWHAELASGGGQPSELVYGARDGRRIPVLVAAAPLRGERRAPRYVVTVRDVTGSHRRLRRLAELSTHDPVTGLLNPRGLEQRLRDAVGQAPGTGVGVSLAFLELDRDLDGPEALLAVERLRALVRAGEAIGRTADDSLAWILLATDARGALEAVARARRELAEANAVTLTAGICDLATAGDALAMYALADRALAEARLGGPGSIVSVPAAPDSAATRLAS